MNREKGGVGAAGKSPPTTAASLVPSLSEARPDHSLRSSRSLCARSSRASALPSGMAARESCDPTASAQSQSRRWMRAPERASLVSHELLFPAARRSELACSIARTEILVRWTNQTFLSWLLVDL